MRRKEVRWEGKLRKKKLALGLLSCILRGYRRTCVGGSWWAGSSRSRRDRNCYELVVTIPWICGGKHKVNSHNEEGAQAINSEDPLSEQRKIQKLGFRIPFLLRQPRTHEEAGHYSTTSDDEGVDSDSIRETNLRDQEVEIDGVDDASYAEISTTEYLTTSRYGIPVLLPASTIPNAKAFLLWKNCPVDTMPQENNPLAARPKPTPCVRKIW
jgi:hypothetical protein